MRNHAEAVLADEFLRAIERTSAETGLPEQTFPVACPYTLDELLTPALLDEDLNNSGQ